MHVHPAPRKTKQHQKPSKPAEICTQMIRRKSLWGVERILSGIGTGGPRFIRAITASIFTLRYVFVLANLARVGSFYPEREPITQGQGAYTRSGSQSRKGSEHIPGAGANHARAGSTYPEREPITQGQGAFTRSGSQSRKGRE
eukprot:1195790-Prorocentrum_minimum.AAC.1